MIYRVTSYFIVEQSLMALLLHDGRQLYRYTLCDRSYSGTLRLLMTENEVLPFLVTESGLWMPEEASSLA